MKHALSVAQLDHTCVYDLLPANKPRKGHEHRLVEDLAKQIEVGWTLAVWDLDRLLRELAEIVEQVRQDRPNLLSSVEKAWLKISTADEEQVIDLKIFQKLPGGHYVAILVAREDFDYDAYPPRLRNRMIAETLTSRPVSEDFWGVLHRIIMTPLEAEQASDAYQRWVRNNRPRPPKHDLGNVFGDQEAGRANPDGEK